MKRMGKMFLGVKDVMEIMGISESKAYEVIRRLNNQLKEEGYLTISGKVSRAYFEEKCLYGVAVE